MESVFDPRAQIQLGVVRGVSDAGQVQRITVETTDGYVYDQVEVMQPAGMASVPPGDGAIALLFTVAGDPGNWRALPISNPATRFGGLQPGEAVVYGSDGSRVAIRAGGTIEVQAATKVIVTAPNAQVTTTGPVTIDAGGGITLGAFVTGPGGLLDIHGAVKVSGTVTAANFTAVGAPPTVAAGLSTAGTTQATATALASPTNVVSGVTAGQGVLVGSTGVPRQEVINTGTVDLTVYPPIGGTFRGMSAGSPVTVPAGGSANFISIGSGTLVIA